VPPCLWLAVLLSGDTWAIAHPAGHVPLKHLRGHVGHRPPCGPCASEASLGTQPALTVCPGRGGRGSPGSPRSSQTCSPRASALLQEPAAAGRGCRWFRASWEAAVFWRHPQWWLSPGACAARWGAGGRAGGRGGDTAVVRSVELRGLLCSAQTPRQWLFLPLCR